ncbi:hypothetical protein D3C86_2187830 [compost metagenome]
MAACGSTLSSAASVALEKTAPKSPPMPALLVELRVRWVWLLIWALSSMMTMTVRMSPTRWARSSLKKPLAEVR